MATKRCNELVSKLQEFVQIDSRPLLPFVEEVLGRYSEAQKRGLKFVSHNAKLQYDEEKHIAKLCENKMKIKLKTRAESSNKAKECVHIWQYIPSRSAEGCTYYREYIAPLTDDCTSLHARTVLKPDIGLKTVFLGLHAPELMSTIRKAISRAGESSNPLRVEELEAFLAIPALVFNDHSINLGEGSLAPVDYFSSTPLTFEDFYLQNSHSATKIIEGVIQQHEPLLLRAIYSTIGTPPAPKRTDEKDIRIHLLDVAAQAAIANSANTPMLCELLTHTPIVCTHGWACSTGTLNQMSSANPEAFRMFLDQYKGMGGDLATIVNQENGQDCLMQATQSGSSDIVEYLLTVSTPNNQDRSGKTPLHIALAQGNYGIARVLLTQGASTDIADKQGDTALHVASLTAEASLWKQLVNLVCAFGADPLKKNRVGLSPLAVSLFSHSLAGCCLQRTLELLMSKQCIQMLRELPLHGCTAAGEVSMLRSLLKAGSDPEVKHPVSQKTALHLAGDISCLKLLLEDCLVGADWKAKDRDGNTPLHYRAQENNALAAAMLLKAGAKYTMLIQNNRGQSPAELAQAKVKEIFAEDRKLRASKYSPATSQAEVSKEDILGQAQQLIARLDHHASFRSRASIRTGVQVEADEGEQTVLADRLTQMNKEFRAMKLQVETQAEKRMESEKELHAARKELYAAEKELIQHSARCRSKQSKLDQQITSKNRALEKLHKRFVNHLR